MFCTLIVVPYSNLHCLQKHCSFYLGSATLTKVNFNRMMNTRKRTVSSSCATRETLLLTYCYPVPSFLPSLPPFEKMKYYLFYTPQIRNPPSLHTLILAHSSPSPPSFLSSLLPFLPPSFPPSPNFPTQIASSKKYYS